MQLWSRDLRRGADLGAHKEDASPISPKSDQTPFERVAKTDVGALKRLGMWAVVAWTCWAEWQAAVVRAMDF